MTWPTLPEIAEALRRPEAAFRDPALRAGRCAAVDGSGRPAPVVGTFAAVFRVSPPAPGRDRAVRVFLEPPRPGVAERYEAAARELAAGRPAALVAFRYDAEAVRLPDGRAVPAVLMDWVEGPTLAAEARARAGAGDLDGLRWLADAWDGLLAGLAEARVAHGDLEARNALVEPGGELRLVDYDTLCVPALAGRPAPEVVLEGNPCQHPGRTASTGLAPDLDTFAGLVIRLELRALAADPGLSGRFGPPASTALLLTPDDLRDPTRSRLFDALAGSDDPEVRRMTEAVFHLYEFPFDALPPLAELVGFGPGARRPSVLMESPARLAAEVATLTPGELEALRRYVRTSPPSPSWLGLAPSPVRRSLETDDRGRSYAVRWSWPETGLPGHCVVAVCAHPPADVDGPDAADAFRRWAVARDEARPFRFHTEPAWRGATVAVWGVVELGALRFHTGPLVLGRLAEGGGVFRFLGR
jgi:hypothetical protein